MKMNKKQTNTINSTLYESYLQEDIARIVPSLGNFQIDNTNREKKATYEVDLLIKSNDHKVTWKEFCNKVTEATPSASTIFYTVFGAEPLGEAFIMFEICLQHNKFLTTINELPARLQTIKSHLKTSELYCIFIINDDINKISLNEDVLLKMSKLRLNGTCTLHVDLAAVVPDNRRVIEGTRLRSVDEIETLQNNSEIQIDTDPDNILINKMGDINIENFMQDLKAKNEELATRLSALENKEVERAAYIDQILARNTELANNVVLLEENNTNLLARNTELANDVRLLEERIIYLVARNTANNVGLLEERIVYLTARMEELEKQNATLKNLYGQKYSECNDLKKEIKEVKDQNEQLILAKNFKKK
jgi:hypothetical protein